MNRRESDRVAKIIAAMQLQHLMDVGSMWDRSDLTDAELASIEGACERLCESLLRQSVQNSVPLVTVADAVRAAGVVARKG